MADAKAAPGALMGDQDSDNDPAASYYDSDDMSVRRYGHAASVAESTAIGTLIKSYYSAAAAEDGGRACALTYYIDVETFPEHYGEPPGPLWLRGARTCPAVLTRIFKHFHRQLTVPIKMVSTRVAGDRAEVLVGFNTLPAGVVKARREHGVWKIDGLLAVALP